MAEGMLAGLLGAEGEAPDEVEIAEIEAHAGAEAFAAALAADQAKHDPRVARAAERFLDKQAHLLDLQAEELREQRTLKLSHLRSQSREGKIRRVGQRIRVAMQVFSALGVTLIGIGVVVLISGAVTSRSVVVDAFKAPSALASRGVTGDVIAAGVLDGLQKLQAATRSSTKGLNTTGAWSSEIKIEVPETGMSVTEVDRLLHERFGHDLHIDGDLVQTEAGGLALTVRGENIPAKTFTGAAGELDALTTQAAEYIYSRSQPVRYVAYITQAGRSKEALAFLPSAFAQADTNEDRAALANTWGIAYNILAQPAQAAEKFRLAKSLAPPRSTMWWKAWGNLLGSVEKAEGDEGAWREAHEFLRAAAGAPKDQQPNRTALLNAATVVSDYPLLLNGLLEEANATKGVGGLLTPLASPIAEAESSLHDRPAATRWAASIPPDNPMATLDPLELQADAALELGDTAAAAAPTLAFYKAWLASPELQFGVRDAPCYAGLAYAVSGRRAEADAAFKRAGVASSLCSSLRGQALVLLGDVAGAQAVWAEGIRLMPDLPSIYMARGKFETEHGDLKAAEADLSRASANAPHFADPLKAWGDLLAKEARWKDALAKYDEALKYAPAWAELHQARDAAARKA